MTDMTDDIRLSVRVHMLKNGISQTQLAEDVGLTRQHVSALLTGHRGRLPDSWQRVLDGLGLEVVVRAKAPPHDGPGQA